MKDAVLALTAVMPNGDIVNRPAGRGNPRRATTSPACCRVLGGDARRHHRDHLAPHGIPEAISGGHSAPFPSIKAACDATILTIQSGIPVARIELSRRGARSPPATATQKLSLPETPLLLVEFTAKEAGPASRPSGSVRSRQDLGGGPFEWRRRRGALPPLAGPPRRVLGGGGAAPRPDDQEHVDGCLRPDLAARECVEATKTRHHRVRPHGARSPAMSASNFHSLPLVDSRSGGDGGGRLPRPAGSPGALSPRRQPALASTASARRRCASLESEHGPEALGLMRTSSAPSIRRNLMNPGSSFREPPRAALPPAAGSGRRERWLAAGGAAREIAFVLEPGLTLNAAIAGPLRQAGIAGASSCCRAAPSAPSPM